MRGGECEIRGGEVLKGGLDEQKRGYLAGEDAGYRGKGMVIDGLQPL